MENDDTQRRHLPVPRTDNELPEPDDLAHIFNKVGTQRLILCCLCVEDGSAMFAVHGDPATNLYNPAGPHPDVATSEEM
jgi:[ribosomal protein S5]-alanine N-acetyltransferase